MNRIPHFVFPLGTAVLLLLSFPKWDQFYLAWFSLLPLFIFCSDRHLSRKNLFWGGLATGIIFFFFLYAYMIYSLDFFFPRYFGILIVVVSALYSALFLGIFALGFAYFYKQKRPLLLVLSVPALWVVLEYLRSLGLLGHTGGYLGYSQTLYPFLLQSTALYGYWGLSFLMVLFQTTLFLFLHPLLKKKGAGKEEGDGGKDGSEVGSEDRVEDGSKRKPKALWAPSGYALLIFLALFLGGSYLPALFPVEEREAPLHIALLQGNISQEIILDPDQAKNNFQRYLELTREAAREHENLHLVVWPETVLSTSVQNRFPEAEEKLEELAEETGAALFFGAMYKDTDSGDAYNSILMQSPGMPFGTEGRYDKIRLVPFAEYFPFPQVLNRFWELEVALGSYKPGEEIQLFSVEESVIGGIICFESYFPRPALTMAQKGAEHIFVLTNDAWFLDSNGLEQHARASAVRAVETGRGVTQVANTGYTVSYNYRGEKVLELPTHQKGFALLETGFPVRETLYRRWGDYFLFLCLGLLAASTILALPRRPEKNKK